MNEHDNTFDLTDSILRVLGIIGFFTAVIFGFVVAGGNVITLVHPAEIIIVIGTIFFGLLCTHRSKFLAYLPEALLALVRNRLPIAIIAKYPTMPGAMPQQEAVWRSYSVLFVL